jgi:hypothetical protein
VRGSAVSGVCVGLVFCVIGYEEEVAGARERKPAAMGIRWETGEDIFGWRIGNRVPVKCMLDVCCKFGW